MRSFIIISTLLSILSATCAFSATFSSRPKKSKPSLIGGRRKHSASSTLLKAAAAGAPKKATKKKATKKAADSDVEEEVVTFRKPEFVSRIAEKTGMSKSDSEAALSAVLETITEVS